MGASQPAGCSPRPANFRSRPGSSPLRRPVGIFSPRALAAPGQAIPLTFHPPFKSRLLGRSDAVIFGGGWSGSPGRSRMAMPGARAQPHVMFARTRHVRLPAAVPHTCGPKSKPGSTPVSPRGGGRDSTKIQMKSRDSVTTTAAVYPLWHSAAGATALPAFRLQR